MLGNLYEAKASRLVTPNRGGFTVYPTVFVGCSTRSKVRRIWGVASCNMGVLRRPRLLWIRSEMGIGLSKFNWHIITPEKWPKLNRKGEDSYGTVHLLFIGWSPTIVATLFYSLSLKNSYKRKIAPSTPLNVNCLDTMNCIISRVILFTRAISRSLGLIQGPCFWRILPPILAHQHWPVDLSQEN